MNWFRKLILNFSQIAGFDGWVIAKAEFDFDKDNFFIQDIVPHIVKLKKDYAVINMCIHCCFGIYSFSCNVNIYLLKPFDINKINESKSKKPIEIDKVFPHKNLFFESVYTKENIKSFVNDIDDKNYIHRKENPIVPGFLLAEDLIFRTFGAIKENVGILSFKRLNIEITFYNPLYSNEVVKVYSKMNGIEKILNIDKNEELSNNIGKNINADKNEGNRIKYIAIRNDATECCIFKAISKLEYI